MTATALSKQQHDTLAGVLKNMCAECEADAAVVCDGGGNILAQEVKAGDNISTAAALAAGTFAAARELAATIGEPGFRSIFHKGRKSGILIQSLGGDFLVVVLFGPNSVEGMVRLFLKKAARQFASILAQAGGQSLEDAGGSENFEVEEARDEPAPSV